MKSSRKNVASLAGVALLIAAAAVVVVSFRAFSQIEETAAARKHNYSVIISADALMSELRDAETGQRGYLLTSDEAFLVPYLAVRDSISGHLEGLRRLALINAAYRHLDAMSPLVDAKLAELSRVIELRRNHDLTAAIAVVRSGRGKLLMDAIRAEMKVFIQIEEEAMAQHDADFQSNMRRLFVLIAIVSLLVLLLSLSFVYSIYRGIQQRLENAVHLKTQHLLGIQLETNKQLESAKSAAEKANLAKSVFLSSMSHELRTPLNAILGFAQLLDSDSPPATPSQKANIGQILQAGWHLLTLINEVLDLSLVESGKMSVSPEAVSLAEVLSECQALIEPQGQKRGIKLTFPQFDSPGFVRADRTRLKQVLINLLSNAIKYNQPGGTVVVDCATSTPERTRISVRDTGAGLPPEKLAQLFQPFNRLGREAGGEEGTGIGLVLTKQLVELMGGVIGAESAVGAGSVLWFELRSAVAPQLPVDGAEPAAVTQGQVRNGATLRTLLYVEDNPANLKLVEQLIARRPDMRSLSAVNGDLGIEFARDNQPDVILMDINLPGISGFQALKILREDPVTAHIPVLAISANAMPHDIKKGLEAGFFRYITKPIKVNEFMDALDEALEFAGKRSDKSQKGAATRK